MTGQLGLEPTYQEYVTNMVEVFRAMRRVLRNDGTVWLNLGDSYASGEIGRHDGGRTYQDTYDRKSFGPRKQQKMNGLKPKDLVGTPWRIAFALQADGWWLRQDIIWSKPNPMPESVTDRCTKAHEYIFLLSKSTRYYYDAEAIKEPLDSAMSRWRLANNGIVEKQGVKANHKVEYQGLMTGRVGSFDPHGRNRRSVWEIATQPFSEAHFATFPPALIESCVKAGTSEKGCCAKCGGPWVRQMERKTVRQLSDEQGTWSERPSAAAYGAAANTTQRCDKTSGLSASNSHNSSTPQAPEVTTIGWSPPCSCNAATVPCTVLDPFAGAGTTGLVADRLGCNAILIELNPQYAAMAERRIRGDAPLFAEVRKG